MQKSFFIVFLSVLVISSCDVRPRRPISPSAPPVLDTSTHPALPGVSHNYVFDKVDHSILPEIIQADSVFPDGSISWLPNLEEALEIGPFEDMHLITRMDTVYDAEQFGHQHKVLLLHSDVYSRGQICDGHVCAPWIGVALFTEIEGKWKLTHFKKLLTAHGSWGEAHDVDLIRFGKDHIALALEGGYLAQGHLLSVYRIIDLTHEFGKEIFRIPVMESNSGVIPEGQEGFLEKSTTLKWTQDQNNKYYSIEGKTTTIRTEKNKTSTDSTVMRYNYNEESGMFLEVTK